MAKAAAVLLWFVRRSCAAKTVAVLLWLSRGRAWPQYSRCVAVVSKKSLIGGEGRGSVTVSAAPNAELSRQVALVNPFQRSIDIYEL